MFLKLVLLILIAAISPTTSPGPAAVTKLYKYKTFTFPRTPRISEDELIIKDFSTFVHNHSLHAPAGNKSALRLSPLYYDHATYKPDKYNDMLFGMMKQALYAAQDRMKYLQGILAKYEEDLCFRTGYIFTKMDQLLHDMKRIYSYALKKFDWRTIKQNIIFYKHLTKKNIDITYMVEFMFEFHDRNLQAIEKIFNQGPQA